MSRDAKTERGYGRAQASARLARDRFISLTHEIPEGVPPDVLRLWNVADTALLEFIRALERAEQERSS